MIRNASSHVAPQPFAFPRGTKRISLWRRLVDGLSRAWNHTPLESAIEREVRRQLRRWPEPGDVVLVERIVEELTRRVP